MKRNWAAIKEDARKILYSNTNINLSKFIRKVNVDYSQFRVLVEDGVVDTIKIGNNRIVRLPEAEV